MPFTVAAIWIATLVASTVAWLGLVVWVFRRLRLRYPATYAAIGSPDLFRNNTLRTNWLFFKFLFLSRWRDLDDFQLLKVIRTMRALLIVHLLSIVAFVALFLTIGVKPA